MAITYDGSAITIDGGAVDFAPDVWASDQAGGWGQFTRLNAYQYYLNCPVIITGGAVVTMQNIQLTINTSPTAFAIRVENGTLNVGFISDAATYSVGGPCSIIYLSTGQAYILWADDTNGQLNMYGTYVYNVGNNLGILHFAPTGNAWNNTCKGSYFHGGGDSFHTHNNSITNVYRGFSTFHRGIVTARDCIQNTTYWPITPGTINIGATYKDLYCRDYESLVNIQDQFSGTDAKTIYIGEGFDVDNWEVNVRATVTGNPKVIRQHRFDLNVVDHLGNPLSGVSVGLYNSLNALVFNTTTDVNGNIVQQVVSRSYVQKDWVDGAYGVDIKKNLETDPTMDYGPFKLHIEKSGYFNRYIPGIALTGDFVGRYQLPNARVLTGRGSKGFIQANQCLKYCGDTGFIKMIDCPARRGR